MRLVSIYNLALFAHIVGVLGLFIGMGAQWMSLLRLRRARTLSQAREWSGLIRTVTRGGPVSGALLLAAGVYMTLTAWGFTTPWIDVSLGGMALMMALGMGIVGRRLGAIQRAAQATLPDGAASGAIPPALKRQIDEPLLWIATQLAGGVALGVVFLMTYKPGLLGSLLALAVAIALASVGAALSLKPGGKSPAGALAVPDMKEAHVS
ncbi:MAG TPA: hypothetical protein VF812_08795 [Ktedonobacterales bacterium]